MADELRIVPAALLADQAAAFVGMSRGEFTRQYRAKQVPEPARLSGAKGKPRWSRDELRAWMAHQCPPQERWSKIWAKMLASGNWAAPEVVYQLQEPA